MTLYKRGSVWWVKYMVDGRMHYVSTGCRGKADARFFANAIDTARHAPSLEDAIGVLRTIWREEPKGGMPIDEAWANYERMAKAVGKLSVSAKTIKDRRNRVAALVAWLKRNAATVKDVEGVTGSVAMLYAQHLAESGVKTKTRKNTIMDLSTVWRMLEKASDGIRNPWTDLAPRDVDGERGVPFTREEEAKVLEAAKEVGKQWWEVCMVARWTGLRYGDVAMLRWREMTLARGNALAPRDEVLRVTPSKTAKHGVAVTIPIAKELAEALRKVPRRGDYVFPVHAEMYDQNGGKDIMKFREVLDAAGIEGHTFHSWRHTFRTRLAEAGVDTETAMRLCGHTRVETSRRYDHDEHLDELRKAVEAAR